MASSSSETREGESGRQPSHTPGPWKYGGPTSSVEMKNCREVSTSKVWIAQVSSLLYGAGLPGEAEANARLIAAAPDQHETLRTDAAFLRHYLANYIVSVVTRDERGYPTNSFAAVQIPDWAVKQRLDDIDAAIAKAGAVENSQPEGAPARGDAK